MSRTKAFTLSEILSVILLLGVIASYSIPKIIAGSIKVERNAKFKEVIGILYQVQTEGMLTQELRPTNFREYFTQKLNPALTCTDSPTQGCWPQPLPEWEKDYGVVLHNGVQIMGFSNTTYGGLAPDGTTPIPPSYGRDCVVTDWNGPSPPNQGCEDQLYLCLCFGNVDCDIGGFGAPPYYREKKGQITAHPIITNDSTPADGNGNPSGNQCGALFKEVMGL